MEVEFIGAAREVTGSMHLLHTERGRVLLDCGLFQGRRQESFDRNRSRPMHPDKVDAVVLSHAHIDHSGALPLLVKRGFRGPIYATAATFDLCRAMLEDSAAIQMQDADYVNRLAKKRADVLPIEPLYSHQDVVRALGQFQVVPYHELTEVIPGVQVTLLDAGHVLGSAICCFEIEDAYATRRLVYTGDLGRYGAPILRDPQVPHGAEAMIMESTYGDRLHGDRAHTDEELASAIVRTIQRRGKVVIPSFALERSQEVLLSLQRLRADKRIPEVPVFLDSPLAVRVTDVFRAHPECFDHDLREVLQDHQQAFDFEGLEYVESPERSRAIDLSDEPSIIVSASGMCEFGRVVHHLKATIGSEKNTVIIVGFQAQHTLGRRLVERRRKVSIFGVPRERNAEVVVLNGLSAHADRDGLLSFAEAVRDHGPLRHVILVHGEPQAQQALCDELLERKFARVDMPEPGQRIRL